MPSPLLQQLDELGFAGPVAILSAQQCRRFLAVLSDPRRVAPLDWPKGCAATSRAHYEVATHPALMAIAQEALGEDVMLFGACILTQRPGGDHPWHSDIETSGPAGKTLSVWIGLENPDGAMQFVSRSHAFGATVQEVRQRAGKKRKDATAENVLEWARQRDGRAELVTPAVGVGEALLFQGQAWHHSSNRGTEIRRALLLQYATPSTPIRMPAPGCVEWPFQYRQNPKPACIMITGSDNSGGGVNRIVPPPAPASKGIKSRITDQVCPLALPLAADEESGFTFYPMFTGATADLREMEVHVSALRHGQMPHPPHTHREEEILIMLAGEADLILPQVKGPHGDERFPLKPGEFVYYPAHFPHTLRPTSAEPANYLMFKWDAPPMEKTTKAPLAFGHFNALAELAPATDPAAASNVRTKKLLDGPTGVLRKLHAHASVLEPDAGYAPHADAYDVAIIVLEGEVETLGQRVGPGGTIFHAAGQLHGIHNPGATRARYVVFEFHGGRSRPSEAFPKPPVTFMQKLADPKRWLAKLKNASQRKQGR